MRHVVSGIVLVLLGCYVVLNRREKAGRPKEVRGLEPLQDVLGDGVGSVVLEHGEGMRISEAAFTGSIRKLGSSWRVDCGDLGSYEVPSLNDAEAKILECHQPP